MAGSDALILCDVGNSRMHFWEEGRILHLGHEEGLARYGRKRVYYICVHGATKEAIARRAPAWVDLEPRRCLPTRYRGLGIDREAACLGIGKEGVVVDAGSAVTVDIVEDGVHRGGWIWPGLAALREAYARISPVLAIDPDPAWVRKGLPLSTEAAVGFGVFAPVVETVRAYAPGKSLHLTGGDAPLFASLFDDAVVDEALVFKGMMKMLKSKTKDTRC